MHYDFLILDLANAINGCLIQDGNKFNLALLKTALHEYNTILPLNQEERNALFLFFRIRLLSIICHYKEDEIILKLTEEKCNAIVDSLTEYFENISAENVKKVFDEFADQD